LLDSLLQEIVSEEGSCTSYTWLRECPEEVWSWGCLHELSADFAMTESTEDLEGLKQAFALFDRDRDGEINKDELAKVMRAHGFNPTDEELGYMIQNVDTNKNGAIDLNEFIAMMEDKKTCKAEDDVHHAFKVFDRDGDGLISSEELRLTMNNLGEPVTEAEVKSMIDEADLDGDGKINFEEFKTLMSLKINGI